MKERLVIEKKNYKGETSVISARIPRDLITKIDEIATVTGRNRNEIIQLCLEFAVDNLEIK